MESTDEGENVEDSNIKTAQACEELPLAKVQTLKTCEVVPMGDLQGEKASEELASATAERSSHG